MVIDKDLDVLAEDIRDKNIHDSKIVITGSTGLLGSVFVKGFLVANNKYKLNNTVFALARSEEKAKDVLGGIDDSHLIVRQYQIEEPINIDEDVDYVYHFAAITSSKDMVTYPVELIESTMLGIFNILKFSKQYNAKSVVFMSTMETFGIAQDQTKRLTEKDLGYLDLTSVRSCYPESKRLAENYCTCFAKEYGLNVKVARLTQTFGAGAKYDDARVFGMVARSAVENKDIVLFSKGDLARDYCYTTDALNAVLYISEFGESGEVYNVANEETQTNVINMCRMIAREFTNDKIQVRIEIPEDVASKGFSPASITQLDTTKLKALGWNARYNLKDMYARLIESYREQLLTNEKKGADNFEKN